jgi:hypothetical protein
MTATLHRKLTLLLLLAPSIFTSTSGQSQSPGAKHTPSLAWMDQYIGKSPSGLVSDARFKTSLAALLPTQAPLAHTRNTVDAAQQFMAQGQYQVDAADGFLIAKGCLPHACNVAGGWLWADTGARPALVLALIEPKTGIGVPNGVLPSTLVLVSKGPHPDRALPEPARRNLAAWLKSMGAVRIADFAIETSGGRHTSALPSYLDTN